MTNEIKDNEVTLGDLRALGRQGGATARLDTGEEIDLTSRYALVTKKGFINGEIRKVKVILDYVTIYSQIRTIKRDNVLIARRVKFGSGTVLRLTGHGYHRQPRPSQTKGELK